MTKILNEDAYINLPQFLYLFLLNKKYFIGMYILFSYVYKLIIIILYLKKKCI